MSLDTIRISKQGRDQLITLKRRTGVPNWNTLCRWAFCLSLAEDSPPRMVKIPADSPVEMTWRTFAGDLDDVFLVLLRFDLHRVGIPVNDETLADYCRLHIHRGIGYLVGDPRVRNIADLVALAIERTPSAEPSDAGDPQTSNGNRPQGVVETRTPRRRIQPHRSR